ncbi:TPA: hypothetical protein N0F65_005388 [Lagenidium giganteum]|uniref:Uncharacterized protein n=1 Tax=Lagenidium giganteum TaxID=4803 RepID=A0AAV2Z213_9STRA|nr:TPA: hypothetical protein N0F65_005388 [Lagenidium giganteum]
MKVVSATMSKMHLPSDLSDRIRQYYIHLWEEYESLDGDVVSFSRELADTLWLEEQICDVVVMRCRASFGHSSNCQDVQQTLDSSDAAIALVERINIDLGNETIKYGFQGFDKSL